jgi:hypothetical protein
MKSKNVSSSGNASVAVGGDVNAPIFTNPRFYLTSDASVPDPGDWPRVRETNALSFGVHRTWNAAGAPALPAYVERDVDVELAERAMDISAGGVLLLTGDSTSGKTRTAYNFIRRFMPNYRVYAPTPGVHLSGLPQLVQSSNDGPFLIWLDDLDGFLGRNGVDPLFVEVMQRLGVPLVCTIRDDLFDSYTGQPREVAGREGQDEWHVGNRLLRMLEPVRLERIWSPSELTRASRISDERVSEALKHCSSYGVSEYLAAGPSLMQAWRRASRVGGHPRGAALVRASVDLARAGFTGGVDIEVLRDIHVRYLTNPSLRPESWEEALSWATEVLYGVSSLLVPGAYEETWHAFDYLPDALSRDRKASLAIPGFIWEEALALNSEDEGQWLIGMRAYMAGQTEHAITAWRPLAERGYYEAASNLVAVYLEKGDAQAVRHWRRIAAQDDFHSQKLAYPGVEYDPEDGTVATGRSRSGERVKFQLHKPGDGVRHAMIVGAPGIGKSNTLSIVLLGALSSQIFTLGLLDWSHDQKHFAELREAAFLNTGNDLQESIELLTRIERCIDFRIGDGRYEVPTRERPAILLAIEDAHILFDQSVEAVRLALRILRDGRRVSVCLYVTIPDISLESFGGDDELRQAFADRDNTAFFMGDVGLQMWRDLDLLRSGWEAGESD